MDKGFAARRARRSPSAETDAVESINLVDDDGEEQGAGRDRSRDGRRRESGKKRPRVTSSAAIAGVETSSQHRAPKTKSGGRGCPVIVMLGCQEWELVRGKLLCEELGQRRLHTTLVMGATHVIVGTEHTVETSGSGDADDERGQRHRLINAGHTIGGYREAVLLGLWVLDFCWVQACLQAMKDEGGGIGSKGSGKSGGMDADLRVVSSVLAAPRDFELVGCSEQHKGCEPRRGRFARIFNQPRVFRRFAFCVMGDGGSDLDRPRLERQLKLGGGYLIETARPKRVTESYLDDPFAHLDALGSGADEFGEGNYGGVSAPPGKIVVVVALSDLPDEGVSRRLARAAVGKSEGIEGSAAVGQAWVLRSIEKGSPAAFEDHTLDDFLESALPSRAKDSLKDKRAGVGGGGGGARGTKGRLMLPPASKQHEVVLDNGNEWHSRHGAHALVDVRRKELLEEAELVVNTRERVNKQAARVGKEGFQYTRVGGSKVSGVLDPWLCVYVCLSVCKCVVAAKSTLFFLDSLLLLWRKLSMHPFATTRMQV